MYKNSEFGDILDHFSEINKLDFNNIHSNQKDFKSRIIDDAFIYLDFNRNLTDSRTLPLLEKFLISKDFFSFRKNLFNGKILNTTENKSADHIALRNSENDLFTGNRDVKDKIIQSLKRIKEITRIIHSGRSTEYLAGNMKHVVHIGIGGSDLGPRLVADALREYQLETAPQLLFASSVDPYELQHILNKIDLEKTLFVVVSKSFKTPEILLISEYFINALKNKAVDYKNRFIIVSANASSREILKTHGDNFIEIPDTIGGRFSLWSATGLSISLYLGYERFIELLNGAAAMDRHFLDQSPLNNIPAILALLEFWYTNFFQSKFYTVNPYTERLRLLPMYLQQLQMESNGKSTDLAGNQISYPTSSAVIGVTGTACQHSYFQSLHQGNHFFHADFIGLLRAPDFEIHKKNYAFLFSSMLAQAQTLIAGYKSSEKQTVEQHKKIEGNKPCNLILLKEWSPAALGNLLAMYEHKTAVLGVLWQVNSFDQWGVERGKEICAQIENYINHTSNGDSTSSLIDPLSENDIQLFKTL
jgi:glucose-6-phosphate isomerase